MKARRAWTVLDGEHGAVQHSGGYQEGLQSIRCLPQECQR